MTLSNDDILMMARKYLMSQLEELDRRCQGKLSKKEKLIAFAEGINSKTDEKAEWKSNVGKASKGYWAKMTPEERSIEMKRRLGIARKNSAKKLRLVKEKDSKIS